MRNGDCVQDTLERAGNLNKNSNSLIYQLKEGGAETNEKEPLLLSEHSPKVRLPSEGCLYSELYPGI